MPRPNSAPDAVKAVQAQMAIPETQHTRQVVSKWQEAEQPGDSTEQSTDTEYITVIVTNGESTVKFLGTKMYFSGPKRLCHVYLSIKWNLSPDETINISERVIQGEQHIRDRFFAQTHDCTYQTPADLGDIDIALLHKILNSEHQESYGEDIQSLIQEWKETHGSKSTPGSMEQPSRIDVDDNCRTCFVYEGSPVRPIINGNIVDWVYINPVHPKFPCEGCGKIDHDYTTCVKRKGEGPCFYCQSPEHHEDKCMLVKATICTICRARDDHNQAQCPHLIFPPPGDLNDPKPPSAQFEDYDDGRVVKAIVPEIGVIAEFTKLDEDKQKQVMNAHRIDEHGERKSDYVSATMACFVTFSKLKGELGLEKIKWSDPRPLAQYNGNYASSLGSKQTIGYRDTIEVNNARYGTRSVHIRHGFWKELTSTYKTFADTYLYYSALIDKPTVTEIGKGALRPWLKARGYDDLPNAPPYNALVLAFDMDASDIINGIHHIPRHDEVARLTSVFGDEFTAQLDALQQLMTNSDTPRRFEIALAYYNEEVKEVASIFVEGWQNRDENPYQKLMLNAPDARFGSFDQLIKYQDCDFERQEQPQVYLSPSERSVRLSYAIAHEFQLQDGLSELTSRQPLQAVAIPIPDMTDYGYPTVWLLFAKDLHRLANPPRPDGVYKIEFNKVPYELGELPETKVDKAEAIHILVKGIIKALQIGGDLAENGNNHHNLASNGNNRRSFITSYLKQHFKSILATGLEVDDGWLNVWAEWLVKEKSEDTNDYEARIRPQIEKLWKENKFQAPTKTVEQTPRCTAICRRLGKEWEDIGSIAFIVFAPPHPHWNKAWGKPKPIKFKVPKLRITEKLNGKRFLNEFGEKMGRPNLSVIFHTAVHEDTSNAEIKAVTDATFDKADKDNFALFHLWICDFNKKFLRYLDLEAFPAVAHLADRISGKPANECRHFTATAPVPVSPETKSDEAVTDQVKGDDKLHDDEQRTIDLATFHRATRYDTEVATNRPQRGVTQEESNRLLQEYFQLNKEQQDIIMRDVKQCPHGTIVICGCPGSGKSTTLIFLLKLLCWDSVNPKLIQALTNPNITTGTGENGLAATGDNAETPRIINNVEAAPANNNTSKPTGDDTWGSANDNARVSTDDNAQPTSANGVAETAPPTWDTRPPPKNDVPFNDKPPQRIQAVVVGANNEQLNDIAAQIYKVWTRLDPNQEPKVIRASIASSATGRIFRENDEEYMPGEFATMLEPERLLADLMKDVFDKRAEGATIWKSPESIESAVNKYMAQNKDSPLIKRIFSNLAMRDYDPGLWEKVGNKTHKQLSEQLIKFLYSEADVIVCTPLVASSISTAVKAQILVIDEDRRMAEPSSLIPLTQFKDVVVRIFSGDSKQIKPLVFSANSHRSKEDDTKFLNAFARQLELPLGTRIERSGAVRVHRLRVNFRARGGVSQFASEEFYDGFMTEAPHDRADPVIIRLRNFLKGITHDRAGGSSVFLNIKGDDNESSEGYSTINRVNAECIEDLVVMIFDAQLCHADGKRLSIGIVTPYEAQVNLIKKNLSRLTSAEIIRELIEVRTAQGMQGYEHDLIIIDLVRSKRTGFIKQSDIGAVMTSRARYGCIIVGNTIAWARTGRADPSCKWLSHIEDYHLDRAAIQSFPKETWGSKCPDCYRTHRKKQADCGKIECRNCHQKHHVRNCPSPIQHPLTSVVETNNPPEFKGWPKFVRKDKEQTSWSRQTRGRRTLNEIKGMKEPITSAKPAASVVIDHEKFIEDAQYFNDCFIARRREAREAELEAEREGTEYEPAPKLPPSFLSTDRDALPEPDILIRNKAEPKYTTVNTPADMLPFTAQEVATYVTKQISSAKKKTKLYPLNEWELIYFIREEHFTIVDGKHSSAYKFFLGSLTYEYAGRRTELMEHILIMISDKLRTMRESGSKDVSIVDPDKFLSVHKLTNDITEWNENITDEDAAMKVQSYIDHSDDELSGYEEEDDGESEDYQDQGW